VGKKLRPKPHPLANQFPMMSAPEFEALKADIEENGLNDKILLFQGKILDGRNRYQACLDVGIEPEYEDFSGTYEEAQQLSASANLTRRHLSKSQKAMVIAKNGLAAAPSASATERDGKDTIRDAAGRYGVNHMTIYKAFYVYENDKDLATQVLNGKTSVGRAEARIRARLNPAEDDGNDDTVGAIQKAAGRLIQLAKAETDEKALRQVLRQLERATSTLLEPRGGGSR